MNLKTWKNIKKEGQVQKADVTIAKNYLNEKELAELNTLVNMFLDYAELQAEKNRVMKMRDWINRVDAFLRFNEYKVLDNAGSVRKDVADKFAQGEYERYKIIQMPTDINNLMSLKESGTPIPKDISPEITVKKFDEQLKGLLKVPPPKKDKQ